MSQDYRDKIYDLMSSARELNDTPEALALAEEAVQLADSHNDAELSYAARMRLMDVTAFSGDSDKLLVAFSWCLAHADKQVEKSPANSFSGWELLWKYKWVTDKLVHFPRISRAQIFSTVDDFESRCRKAGYNDRAALSLRCSVEMDLGNLPAAREWHAKWKLTKRDGMADCEACEINRTVELLAALDDHEAAIRAAAPILNGRKRCGEIPHLTYAALLRSFWLTRGPEEAARIHEKGYRLVRGNRDFIREHARHIFHLLRSEQLDQATTLIRRHLKWALETRNLDRQFQFLLATRAVMRRLGADGAKSVRLRLPPELCPLAGKTTVVIPPFLKWLDAKIESLATAFDQRNGNQWFAQLANGTRTEF